jgi:hypothetical protein
MKLPAHNRYDCIPIHHRPQYEWSGGAPWPSPSTTISSISPSVLASAATLDEFALPGAHNVNSAVLEQCPEIVDEMLEQSQKYRWCSRSRCILSSSASRFGCALSATPSATS